MKLTAKLVLIFMIGIISLTGVYGYLAVRREVQQFEDDARADAHRIGTALEEMIAIVWRDDGEQAALRLIQHTGRRQQHLQIRWVWFDASQGDPYQPLAPRELLTAVLIEQHEIVHVHGPDGEKYLHAYWPIPVTSSRQGGLELSRSMAVLEENTRITVLHTVLLMAAMVLLAGLLVALAGIRMVGRPLKILTEKTRRAAAGDLSGDVRLQGRDELSELAQSLNSMCHRLTQSQQEIQQQTAARTAAVEPLRHADRLGTVGRLASGIAHELGTPLNVVSGRAGLIASGKLTDDDVRQSAQAIKSEADRIAKIIRELMDFARQKTPHKSLVDLRQVARQTLDLLDPVAVKRNYSLVLDGDAAPLMVMIDGGQVQQVLTNLIVNAAQSMPQGGTIRIEFHRRQAVHPEDSADRLQEFVCIDVQDEGEGIAAADLPHIFEPFFTTKDVGKGTGLGLSISLGIVQDHGGWIGVQSAPGEGARFTIYLPAEVTECPEAS